MQEEEVDGGASDWEYEYDESETESFFVTLDFTTHAPNTRKRKHNDADDTSGDAQRPSEAPTDSTPALNDETPAPGDETPAPIDRTRAPIAKPDIPVSTQNVDHSPKRLQFLDLATSNPLISYKKELWTCDWASAIGTDIFLSKPLPTAPLDPCLAATPLDPSSTVAPSEPSSTPVPAPTPTSTTAPTPLSTRSGYNILGLSSLRLVAKPAQLTTRPIPLPTDLSSAAAPSAPAPTPTSTPTPTPALIPTTAPTSQQTFLTRLTAIKAVRGDIDTVPLTSSHVDFSRTPLSVPSLDALRDVPPTPQTSTPRASARGRGRSGGRERGSRGGRGGVASVNGAGEGEGGDEEVATPKPRRKREGPGRWGSGRGRRPGRGRGRGSTRGRGGAGGGGGEEDGGVPEVVVDPRLENLGVDGVVVTESGEVEGGAAEQARPDVESSNMTRPPDSGVNAVADQATPAQETSDQSSRPQATPTTEDRTSGD